MRSKRDDYKRKLLPGHTVGRQNNSHGKTNEFILTPSRKKSLKGRGFSVDKCERCGLMLLKVSEVLLEGDIIISCVLRNFTIDE